MYWPFRLRRCAATRATASCCRPHRVPGALSPYPASTGGWLNTRLGGMNNNAPDSGCRRSTESDVDVGREREAARPGPPRWGVAPVAVTRAASSSGTAASAIVWLWSGVVRGGSVLGLRLRTITSAADQADLMEDLSDAEWRTPSLCPAWTVRQVATHLTLAAHGGAPVRGRRTPARQTRQRNALSAGAGAQPFLAPACSVRRGRPVEDWSHWAKLWSVAAVADGWTTTPTGPFATQDDRSIPRDEPSVPARDGACIQDGGPAPARP